MRQNTFYRRTLIFLEFVGVIVGVLSGNTILTYLSIGSFIGGCLLGLAQSLDEG